MFARHRQSPRRRGIVLVLILGMLGLLALIGVTFATFAGQAQVGSRAFASSLTMPDADTVMNFGIDQLINDTTNPLSALRGHSLKRDMYGNDSAIYVYGPNGVLMRKEGNGYLGLLPNGLPLQLTNYDTNGYYGFIEYQTNIPINAPGLYSVNFTRWHLKLGVINAVTGALIVPPVPQNYEVLWDDTSNSHGDGFHWLTLAPNQLYPNPSNTITVQTTAVIPGLVTQAFPLGSGQALAFTLDGRYRKAFNGPGMGPGASHYANFRLNGPVIEGALGIPGPYSPTLSASNGTLPQTLQNLGDPERIGMDEDYDACDLENWFLAIQSADGQVMIPSFHRPGILARDPTAAPPSGLTNDWLMTHTSYTPGTPAYIQALAIESKFLRPRRIDGHDSGTFPDLTPGDDGKITYDVDNDGDGVTDSVWLDLGYPAQRDAQGRLFKPLFAFMVLGLNGRLPLNSAGNLQARDPDTGTPLWEHASSHGVTENELNPSYALWNAASPPPSMPTSGTPLMVATGVANPAFPAAGFWQNDTAGVPVSLTQLRNLLTGTRPQANPKVAAVAGVNPAFPTGSNNGDLNYVSIGYDPASGNNLYYYMPNNVLDNFDNISGGVVLRPDSPVAGRWGEESFVPNTLTATAPTNPAVAPYMAFNSLIRAGRSVYQIDGMDDDFDGMDWYGTDVNGNYNPEHLDYYDGASQVVLPSERYRRAVTPRDISGNGRVVAYGVPLRNTVDPTTTFTRAPQALDYGTGQDRFGRISFFQHHRPAGVPPLVGSPFAANPAPYDLTYYSALPGSYLANGTAAPDSSMANNLYHGYEAARWPDSATMLTRINWFNIGSPTITAPFNYFRYFAGMPTDFIPSSPPPIQTYTSQGTSLTGVVANTNDRDPSGSGAYYTYNQPPFPPQTTGQQIAVTNGYPGGDLAYNTANEMDLYGSDNFDAPFGAGDLEWLYRGTSTDPDAGLLTSRLDSLAPISFLQGKHTYKYNNQAILNDPTGTGTPSPYQKFIYGVADVDDGLMHRRMFSLDFWEPTTYVSAHDNPVVAQGAGLNYTPFAYNRHALPANLASYGLAPFNVNADVLTSVYANPWVVNGGFEYQGNATSLSYAGGLFARDRKLNLNFPLPASNRHDEPVRQRWVLEAYNALKQVLPPQAVDTPEELAALSQYLVNVVDFRDPDGAMTQFINPDIAVKAPANVTDAMTGAITSTPATLYLLSALPGNTVVDFSLTSGYAPLVQYGMEYNPIAINEVLAFQYQYRVSAGMKAPNPRLFIELVNTLTRAMGIYNAPKYNPSDLTLPGWEFVLVPDDDQTFRPDPVTGQLPPQFYAANPVNSKLPILKNSSAFPANSVRVQVSYQSGAALGASGGALPPDPGLMTQTSDPTGDPKHAKWAQVTDMAKSPKPKPVRALLADGGGAADNKDPSATPGPTVEYYYLMASESTDPSANSYDNDTPDINASGNTPQISIQFPKDWALIPKTPGKYYWLYLLRPANPVADPTDPSVPRVVVDSIRFPYMEEVPSSISEGPIKVTLPADKQPFYSLMRHQPYRGGQAVPYSGGAATTTVPPSPPWAYGYVEELRKGKNSGDLDFFGYYGDSSNAMNKDKATDDINHTLGKANSNERWDVPMVLDRDFTSPAELLMVPGVSPGLFTKQYVYEVPPASNPTNYTTLPVTPPTKSADPTKMSPDLTSVPDGPSLDPGGGPDKLRTYPYLVEEFFYTGKSSSSQLPANGGQGVVTPTNVVGGWTGAGWHKMLDFLEVPSLQRGAFGPAAAGVNFDWFRQDLRHGQINLNLVMDEEVFFGILDDPNRLNYNPTLSVPTAGLDLYQLPRVVTEVHPTTLYPSKSYPMSPRGFFDSTQVTAYGGALMKAAFSDFLKVRHGGSGFLFAYGQGAVGSGDLNAAWLYNPSAATALAPYSGQWPAAERPFHSLSYPDINMTVLRPATLPPSVGGFTTPSLPQVPTTNPGPKTSPLNVLDRTEYPSPDFSGASGAPGELYGGVPALSIYGATLNKYYIGDPGVKNPWFEPGYISPSFSGAVSAPFWWSNNGSPENPSQVPPVPPRRLFQVPDAVTNTTYGATPQNSNASEWGDSNVHVPTQYVTGSPPTGYSYPVVVSLLAPQFSPYHLVAAPFTAGGVTWQWTQAMLGGYNGAAGTGAVTDPFADPANAKQLLDHRQSPYYRTEWLQKVMNLTTVRTHQYAVWVTVGFFEVKKEGNPQLAEPDLLGQELQDTAGSTTRYRAFYIIDRTRAVGFNSPWPGVASNDYRDCVVYRKIIQ